MNDLNADYVIVGAGSAGCVLANRLSADGRHSVVLLEAGPRDRYPWIHIPIGYAKTMFNPRYNWCLYTEPDPGMHDRRIYWPRGKVLGGSSSINGLIFIRGQKEDYDHWESLGNRGWGWKDVLPYFVRSEKNQRGPNPYHGADGHQGVSDIIDRERLAEAFVDACIESGIPRNDDFNGAAQEGCGFYQLITWRGRRCSSAVGYLKPAKKRRNLMIETGALATGIEFDGSRAAAIRFIQGGKQIRVSANKEIVLCAGAIQSPQLLQLSGIGDAETLRQHEIKVMRDLPGVGRNLQDHLQIRVINRCTEPITTNDYLKSPWRKFKMGLQYMLSRTGPLSIGINQAGAFVRTGDHVSTPDIQFHFAALSSDLPGSPLHDFSGFTSSICQLRPTSRGHLKITNRDPNTPPAMHPHYLSTDEDRETVVAGLKIARRVMSAPALAGLTRDEYMPGTAVTSDDELLDFARETGVTIFHPSGTCKMGNDDQSVVDHRLRVIGVQGLRVADCSIMPTLVSGNTHAPAVMIGEKAADMILQDAG